MNIAKLKLVDLRRELQTRQLETTGNKTELLARLKLALDSEHAVGDSLPTETDEKELLEGEEEDEDVDISTSELDAKLLDSNTPTSVECSSFKPKKRFINRDSAASAQLKASTNKAESSPTESGETENAGVAEKTENGGATENSQPSQTSVRSLSAVANASADERKALRMARFTGSTTSSGTNQTTDIDKIKRRAERFGEVVSNKMKKYDEDERVMKRKERFGIVSADDAKQARAIRFGGTSGLNSGPNQQALQARAARFGL